MTSGQENEASGVFSRAGGFGAIASQAGQKSTACGIFNANGDAQWSDFVASRSVTHSDASWYSLFVGGASVGQLGIDVATDTVMTFDCLIVGTTQGCTKSFSFRIEGAVENDGGTTSILASTVTTIYDADDVSFDAQVAADDPNDRLLIQVQDTDGTGDTVRWVAVVRTSEVTYPA